MSVNDLVLVQGMKHTRLALSRWNREPAVVLMPWLGLSVLISCRAAARRCTASPCCRARPHRLRDPRLQRAGRARRLPARALSQLARARAARAGLRGGLHRRQLAAARLPSTAAACRAGCTRRPGRSRSASSSARRSSRSTTQAYIIGGTASSIAGQLGVAPGTLLLRSRRTRCRSWWRSSCRWRPGCWRAAGATGRSSWPRPS